MFKGNRAFFRHLKVSIDFWLHCLWLHANVEGVGGLPPRRRSTIGYTKVKSEFGRRVLEIHALVHAGDSPFEDAIEVQGVNHLKHITQKQINDIQGRAVTMVSWA